MAGHGQLFADCYRSVSQDLLVETLLLEGYAHAPDRDAARGELREVIARWRNGGLAARETAGGPLFDPVEAMWHAKTAGLRGEDDFWQARFVTTLRRFVTELETEAPDRVTLHYRRSFSAIDGAAGKARRLRMPLPLGNRYAAMDIAPELPDAAIGHRVSDGRLEVRVEGTAPVTIGARIDLDLGAPPPEPAPEGDLYLREKDGLVVQSSKVAALARHLAGDARGETAAHAFRDYVMDEFVFCPIHYDQVDPDAPLDWVLASGVYDCQLAAALFAGLCRAQGIPARMVSGNFLYRLSPTNHFWGEIWLDHSGWTPFDFLGWDLSAGGRDAAWRDRFFGQVDPRLVTECLPAQFTGAAGVPIPDRWHVLRTMAGRGAAIELAGLDGRPVYRDTIERA